MRWLVLANLELRHREVRRISLLRGWMNNLHARWGLLPRIAPARGWRLSAP